MVGSVKAQIIAKLKDLVAKQEHLTSTFDLEEVQTLSTNSLDLLQYLLAIVDQQDIDLAKLKNELEKVSELEVSSATDSSNLAKQKQSLQENLVNLEHSWQVIHDDRKEVERSLQTLNETSLQFEYEKDNLECELGQVKYQLAEVKTNFIKLEISSAREIETWKNEAEDLVKQITNFQESYQNLSNELAQLGMEIQAIFTSCTAKQLISEAKITNMTNLQQIADLTQKVTEYQVALTQIKESIEEFYQKKTNLERDLATALQELAELKKEKENHHKDQQEAEIEFDKVDQGVDELGAQILEISNLLAKLS
jgi:chromosome segregation ATPase